MVVDDTLRTVTVVVTLLLEEVPTGAEEVSLIVVAVVVVDATVSEVCICCFRIDKTNITRPMVNTNLLFLLIFSSVMM